MQGKSCSGRPEPDGLGQGSRVGRQKGGKGGLEAEAVNRHRMSCAWQAAGRNHVSLSQWPPCEPVLLTQPFPLLDEISGISPDLSVTFRFYLIFLDTKRV